MPFINQDHLPTDPMEQNFVSSQLTDAERDEILALLDAVLVKLKPVAHELTPQERGTIVRIRPEDLAILEQALDFARQNPAAVPDDVDVDELAKDIALARQEQPILAKVQMVHEVMQDASMSVLSDAYDAALDIYRIAKAINKSGRYDTFVRTFGARFARRRRAKPNGGAQG